MARPPESQNYPGHESCSCNNSDHPERIFIQDKIGTAQGAAKLARYIFPNIDDCIIASSHESLICSRSFPNLVSNSGNFGLRLPRSRTRYSMDPLGGGEFVNWINRGRPCWRRYGGAKRRVYNNF